jgi:hypothetical protein
MKKSSSKIQLFCFGMFKKWVGVGKVVALCDKENRVHMVQYWLDIGQVNERQKIDLI